MTNSPHVSYGLISKQPGHLAPRGLAGLPKGTQADDVRNESSKGDEDIPSAYGPPSEERAKRFVSTSLLEKHANNMIFQRLPEHNRVSSTWSREYPNEASKDSLEVTQALQTRKKKQAREQSIPVSLLADKSESGEENVPTAKGSDATTEGKEDAEPSNEDSENQSNSNKEEQPEGGPEKDNNQSNDKQTNGSGSKSPGEDEDSIGGPYMPRPIKQNKVAKRKKIIYTIEQLMKFQADCDAIPKGFPTELMKAIETSDPAQVTPMPQPNSGRSSSSGDSPQRAVASEKAVSALVPAPVSISKHSSAPERVSYHPPAHSHAHGHSHGHSQGHSQGHSHHHTHSHHSAHHHPPRQATKTVAPLVKSANRWQPSMRMTFTQKMRGYLNKLSPEQHEGLFEKLYELVKLNCKTTEDLMGLVNEVFDKAVTEKNYSWLYAKLSHELSDRCPTFRLEKKLTAGKKISRVVEFKNILLTRCQKEFQGKSAQILKMKDRIQNTDDIVIKEILIDKMKERRQGNVRFIGELFKVKLEAAKMERILHMCVQHLLRDIRNPDEEDVVCLEVLLETAGKQLDVPKARSYMNQYFGRIRTMAKNPKLPLRLTFKCEDLLDLRKRKWASRKEVIKVPGNDSKSNHNHRQIASSRPEVRREPVALPKRVGNRYGAFTAVSPASPASVTLVKFDPVRTQPTILKKAPSVVKKDVTFNLNLDSKSSEKIERDVIALIKEYYGCGKRGLEEAALCVQDIGSPAHHWMIVQQAILLSLERKERERKLTLELLVWLFLKKKMLTSVDFSKG